MEAKSKQLLLTTKNLLKSSDLDFPQLVKYLKARKLISAKIYQSTVSMERQDAINLVFDSLNRKECKGWVAIRDWLTRNAPSDIYQSIAGEDDKMCKRKLLTEFDAVVENQSQQEIEIPSDPMDGVHASDLTLTNQETEMKDISEDAMSDPWKDCSDDKLMQYMEEVEQGQPSDPIDPDEIYLYELWNEILSDNLSMGDVSNNRLRCKLNLGKNIFVTAGMWRGQMKIHLRRYDPSNSFATEKGVVFGIDLWKKLVKMVDVIDKNLEKVQKMNGADVVLEVGEKVHVEIEIGSPKIDIRLWWVPPGSNCLKRTTKGVKLNPWQWDKLKAIFQYLPAFVPELSE